MRKPLLRVLGLGAGIESTCLALMASHGEIGPMPDCAITSDFRMETEQTYENIRWLGSGNVLKFPVHIVSAGDLEADLARAASGVGRISNPPFYSLTKGVKGQLNRNCTRDYKIRIVQAKARAIFEERFGKIFPGCIELWLGISSDEAVRFTTTSPAYIKLRYPFLERASRANGGSGLWFSHRDCIAWMERNGYPVPSESNCSCCPYHSNARWRWIRDNAPAAWAQAIRVDEMIRVGLPGIKADQLFVHRDCVPLTKANIDEADIGPSLFANECAGMCNV